MLKKKEIEMLTKEERRFKAAVIGGVTVLVIGIGALVSVSTVPANSVGIKYNKFSGVQDGTYSEGVYFKVPFVERFNIIDTTVQERTDEKVPVQTKDAQLVNMVSNVKYRVMPDKAFQIYKNYTTLENLNTNIIGNYTQQAMNEVCSEYNVIDILGEKRNEVISLATEALKEKFAKEGVELKSLTIKDMDAGEAIEKAISDEAVAKKAAETAKQKQEQAKADAETKRIQVQGEADANRILSESVTPELIQMKEAEARLKHGWVTVQGADAVVKE